MPSSARPGRYTLSLHDALPIWNITATPPIPLPSSHGRARSSNWAIALSKASDRKSTRLNSSHLGIPYAVFCAPRALHSFPTRRSSDLEYHGHAADPASVQSWARPFVQLGNRFEQGFDRFRERYRDLLGWILAHRLAFGVGFLAFCVASFLLVPFLGQDFFPAVDAGVLRLHVRASTGTRIEESAGLIDRIETAIRREIPPQELQGILDNIGLPISGINLSYSDSGVAGPPDGDILVSLRKGHRPTPGDGRQFRLTLNWDFPGVTFYFLPADIVSETINFGLPDRKSTRL